MSSWEGLSQFVDGFSLKGLARPREVQDRFGDFADYIDALIRARAELGVANPAPVESDLRLLEVVTQDMAEALVLAVAGWYPASAMVFRCAIESLFQYLADEIDNPVGQRRGHRGRSAGSPPPLRPDRQPNPGQILEWLAYQGNEHTHVGRKLGQVYRDLSAFAHRDKGNFGHLAGYLRSLPRRDLVDRHGSKEANDQLQVMTWMQQRFDRGCVIGSLVIKARFASLWRVLFAQTRSDFNRTVEAMAQRCGLLPLLEAERAGQS